MNTNGLKKIKVIKTLKRVGKATITELSFKLGISKSWVWEIVNKVYNRLFSSNRGVFFGDNWKLYPYWRWPRFLK